MIDSATLCLDSSENSGPPSEGPELDQAEIRARRALGLIGGAPQGAAHRGTVQITRSQLADRVGGDRQRHRFVQDGEVSVVVIPRVSTNSSSAFYSANRLAEAEAALEVERQGRQRAEKALAEAQAALHDLQTKIGHANLARDEATEAAGHLRGENQALVAVLAAER